MTFKSLHKSRTFTIIKSLATSPVGICIYNTALILTIISIVYVTFYGLYIFNLYLIDQNILTFLNNMDHGKLISFEILELFGLAFIVYMMIFVYLCVIEISHCIYNTKQKLDNDLKQYECNSVAWQK